MRKRLLNLLAAAVFAAAPLAFLPACEEGAFEDADEEIDEGLEDLEEGVEDLGDEDLGGGT